MKKVHKSTFGILKDNPTEIDSIRTYLRLYRGEDVALDDDVCKDIGLNDLFGYSNRCITPVGELMLYDRFRQMKRSRGAWMMKKSYHRSERTKISEPR